MNGHHALRTLSQTFIFPRTRVEDVARVLAEAPLVGPASVFGDKKAKSAPPPGQIRLVERFEPLPVPLFRFDFELRQETHGQDVRVLIEFSQPQSKRPYLTGQFVWLLTGNESSAILREEINTPNALEFVDRPLHGRRFSVRRYLFFVIGHKRLMKDVATNIQTLADGYS